MSDKQPETSAPDAASNPPTGSAGLPGMLPGRHWTQLPMMMYVTNDDDDQSVTNSSASIASSVLKYRTLNGRTYHSERGNAEYWGANDQQASDVLDLLHHTICMQIDGKLQLAPIGDDIKRAVDIGTGTGIWAIDFADAHPECEVIGTDISPIQPSWIPPNLQFQIDDCTQDWTFDENSVDYVHIRWLVGSVADWNALFRQAYRCLKPGGYLESHETSARFVSEDGSVKENSALDQFGRFFVEGGKLTGRSCTMVEDEVQRKEMEAVGFVDMGEKHWKTPCGTWPKDQHQKEVGAFAAQTATQDVEGVLGYMGNLVGWSPQEIKVYASHLRHEIKDPSIHPYYKQTIVWGRKPLGT